MTREKRRTTRSQEMAEAKKTVKVERAQRTLSDNGNLQYKRYRFGLQDQYMQII